mmetsp:Transcript_63427/g.150315  ORF Transcript_63427/g.150315 Transcript_63427/m.150315 type:complete len:104 (+) Transcript_63427:188-499(+)
MDGQEEAQATCTALAPHGKNGWVYAVKRVCGEARNCEQVCGDLSESQAKGSGYKNLSCLNSLHIYGNQPWTSYDKVGLKTYRYNSCKSGGCGPNYCCCYAGQR